MLNSSNPLVQNLEDLSLSYSNGLLREIVFRDDTRNFRENCNVITIKCYCVKIGFHRIFSVVNKQFLDFSQNFLRVKNDLRIEERVIERRLSPSSKQSPKTSTYSLAILPSRTLKYFNIEMPNFLF